ncbi:MAG TPA: hypothetical protein VNX21_04405 [Candidatus Thermoplasmatota archaeon]|nr:hypothetical protein [Candidatus Thermoplasmatota archaeon]
MLMLGIALTTAVALAPVAAADHDIWVDTDLFRGGAYTDPLPRLVGCAPGWLPAGLGYAHVCV